MLKVREKLVNHLQNLQSKIKMKMYCKIKQGLFVLLLKKKEKEIKLK